VSRQLVEIADENEIGLPTGASSLSTVGPVAVAQAAYEILRGSPSRQSGEMCVRITLRERAKPMRFCNSYVGGAPGSAGAPMVADFQSATGLLDAYRFGVLRVAAVDVDLKLRRDLRQAYMMRVKGPDVVRRGRTITVRVTAQGVRGARFTRKVRVHVPRSTPKGNVSLVLDGVPADSEPGGSSSADLTAVFTVAMDDTQGTDERGPTSVAALARAVRELHRPDGVTASFEDPTADTNIASGPVVLRDGAMRLSGTVHLPVVVK
jgi:hypothetical protein